MVQEFHFEDVEDKDPASTNMKITDFWKQKVKETLVNCYGDNGIREDKVDSYLNQLVADSATPIARVRDIYREKYWEVELDDMLKLVHENKLIIGANGTYTFRHEVRVSELAEMIDGYLASRKISKGIAIKAEGAGDMITAGKYDNIQNNMKEKVNSTYGVSTMPGYILFSPDSASMITSQARELISEMLWTLEKLMESNMTFKNLNELYSYINEVCNTPLNIKSLKKYNIMIPNEKMVETRMRELFSHLPEAEFSKFENHKSLFLMVKNIAKDPLKAINFYYKYNMYNFLRCNDKVMGIFNWIMESGKEFYSPMVDVMEKSESKVYIAPLWELYDIFKDFVVAPIPTYDRVEKYITRGRMNVVVSDTDSVMSSLDTWVDFMNDYGTVKFDKRNDEATVFRAINSMSFICTEICNFMGRNMARHCHVPKHIRHRINIKNEFLFTSMIIYPHIKKNYSALVRLREGELIHKIANTGLALTGSNINPHIKKEFDKIIEEEIHGTHDVSITNIVRRIYSLESYIRRAIDINRECEFGVFSAFKNVERSAEPWASHSIRAVMLWNHINSDSDDQDGNLIEDNTKIYLFNTTLGTEDDLHKIKDLKMRALIKDKLFDNPLLPELVKYGMRTIAVPDTMIIFPEWMADVIDTPRMIERHTASMKSLLPSIGIYVNRIKSNRSHISPLISLG